MNMFKPVGAKSLDEYFDLLTQDRRAILEQLDALIRKTAPQLEPNFLYNMPGYGTFNYLNSKKQELQWPIIAMASQKNYISVYVCSVEDGQYVAEKYKKELGKVSVGKSCIRFKKLEDIDLDVLSNIIKIATKNPGLTYATN